MILPLLAVALQLPAPAPRAPYWQQEVRYEIQASLDEGRGVLGGTQRLTYRNHSPDSLDRISFHLHLNAFRPGSRWSDADSLERRRRFNDLRDPDYGYNRIGNVRINGQAVTAIWPLAPDSTIVRFLLSSPLAPGDSLVVEMDWEGRPSTVARRQGRRGRQYDFAHSYPKVVVYDRTGWNEQPLEPAGEFYGEFATYLVELDVPADQVMGATGVPVCGDPGWDQANRVPDRPIQYQRDYYPRAPRYALIRNRCYRSGDQPRDVALPPPAPGAAARKSVVWYAEDVHHWALSMNPEYRYEGSAWGKVAIHALYRPGDEESWGGGIATQRTARALAWLDSFFGPFAWPQITNLHRIDGGGTEFPMMMHNGSASQGLIIHELGHNYVMGILANNEWREGWMDEGFSEFQGAMYEESLQPGLDLYPWLEQNNTGLDLDGMSEPASLVSSAYRDFTSYNISIYSRGELFFHQLRYLVGDAAMRQIMRTYYDRWKLKHVNEAAFKEVAEEVSGMDLSSFFAEKLHTTALVDYALGKVTVRRSVVPSDRPTVRPSDSNGWESRVEVLRKESGRIPVDVWVFGESDTAVVRAGGLAEREWVMAHTRSRPREITLDPGIRTRDWNMLNNTWRRGWLWPSREPRRSRYLDTWFSERVARDRKTEGFLPTVWYNDAAGITLGLRTRENYFGRFEQNLNQFSVGTSWESDRDVTDTDFLMRFQNPVWLRSPGLRQTLEVYNVEGRFGARAALERTRRPHQSFGPTYRYGASVTWMQPDDFRYLGTGQWEDAGTVELGMSAGVSDNRNGWALGTTVTAAGGLAYNRRGLVAATGRPELDPFYWRGTLEATARRNLSPRLRFGARFFGGLSTSGELPVRQRQIYLAGADPLERFGNPFLRSDGALLVREDVNYHMTGGGNLRAFSPALAAEGLLALNLELERTVYARPRGKLFNRIGLAVFGDAGHALGERSLDLAADAGVGLRAEHRIGQTSFTTRFDVPLYVNRPAFAQDADATSEKVGFRWLFSFEPGW